MQDDQSSSVFSRVSQWLKPKKATAEATPDTTGSAEHPEAHTAMPKEQPTTSPTPSGNEPPATDDAQPRSRSSRSRRSSRRGGRSRRDKPPAAEQQLQAESAEQPIETTPSSALPPSKGGCKLLINTDEPEECRLAVVENGKVESFHIETVSQALVKGNIYKGRITAVEANLQAAFVDIGHVKNGFLPFSDIHPEYYAVDVAPDTHWKDLRIQDVVKKGQEVLVEVVKEATGNKGAMLTTYLSLPGRYLVLMPGSDSAGISRKIDNEAERRELRAMMESLNIPEGIGYIVRTASQEITKTGLAQDLRYLLNLWEEIKKRGQTQATPSLVYKEQNIISRFLRDHYTPDIREILVDNPEALEQVKAFFQLLPATQRNKTSIRLHQGAQPLFHQYHVEKQVEQMFQPTVPLPSGGSIVINPTEALVAIDVNSGRTSKDKDFEESIFLANMEAAEELARQLRMRDLGGLIVVDFIDMRDARHTREVEKKVRECMKRDKAKVDFSKISKFGLMQISRQKMAAPIHTGAYKTCPYCEGRGVIRSVETLALMHLRQIQTGMSRRQAKKVLCRLPIEVAQYILNKKRADLVELESRHQAEIVIEADPAMTPAESSIEFIKGE
jgi:ribonuclease E